MFGENRKHMERNMFDDMLLLLTDAKREKAYRSAEYRFYEEVFAKIDESDFSVLYEDTKGRPNAPVNCMLAALVLRQLKGWTYSELMQQVDYNILTRLALGLTEMGEAPFCEATLFNFQTRLVEHARKEGENLFEKVFEKLTDRQLRELGVRTDIQRCDSFDALSNVAAYSRLRLMIEVLMRLVRVMGDEEKRELRDVLNPYSKAGSGNYVHWIKDEELPRERKALLLACERVIEVCGASGRYEGVREYEQFLRVVREHTVPAGSGKAGPKEASGEKADGEKADGAKAGEAKAVAEDEAGKDSPEAGCGLEFAPGSSLGSGTLQSPDDPGATYSAKGGSKIGYKVNLVETANPENEINLITDVSVAANNTADGTMLAGRMDSVMERMPGLNELHTDGAYGGRLLDPKMAEHGVLHVETASGAGWGKVPMAYLETEEEGVWMIACPGGQTRRSEPTAKKHRAVFDRSVCASCAFAANCRARATGKRNRIYYFEESWATSHRRGENINTIPEERRNIRPNVEATVKEFSSLKSYNGKYRVRGKIRVEFVVYPKAIANNFGRIFRYGRKKAREMAMAIENAAKTAKNGLVFVFHALRGPKPLLGLS